MERRFKVRLRELRKDAEVHPAVLRDVFPRLERFVEPFAESLQRKEQEKHLHQYVSGLLSNVASKNVESIAYEHDEERQGLQKFIGQVPWDHHPMLHE